MGSPGRGELDMLQARAEAFKKKQQAQQVFSLPPFSLSLSLFLSLFLSLSRSRSLSLSLSLFVVFSLARGDY